ncbi:MAG: hypothetical protein KDC87_06860 [Planctomycetes bacterium]|nr:hypothetical protein [Planctomycetota bacterium]
MHALGEKVFVVQDSSIVMWQGGRERVIHQTADQSRITDLGTFAGGVLFGTQETNGNVGAAWWHDGTLSASRQLVRLGKAPFSGEAVANERAAWLLLTRAQDLAPELWRWDGSAAPQMVAKFEYAEPWRLSRHPRLLCADGGRVLFRAWQPATGSELWRADGSPEGTKLVADIEPGPMSSEPRNMLRVGTRLMFSATTVEHGEEPWVTDGGDSTSILRDIMPGPGSSLSEFTVFYPVGGFTAYFAARDLTGNRLWKSNGSTVTNRLGVTDPYNLGFSNGILYFQAFDSTHGREVWGLQPNVATVQTLGHGCAALTPATPPTIAASLPILGQTFLLNGTTAGSSGLNVLVFGAKAVRPIALSNDCRIYYSAVDIMLSTYVTGSRWQIGVPVPNDPALLYTHAVTQGVLFGMGPGVDLTPAVAFTLGG